MHHRQHAIEFLDKANTNLKDAQIFFSVFSSEVQLSALSVEEQAKKRGEISTAQVEMIEASAAIAHVLAIMKDPNTSVLDEVRGIINSPREDLTNKSVLFRLGRTFFYVSLFIESQPVAKIPHVVRNLADAWENVDFALWHINDAIREEVYQDPNFSETP